MENESIRTAMKIAGLEIERDSLQRCVTELESTIAAQAAVIERVRGYSSYMKQFGPQDKLDRILNSAPAVECPGCKERDGVIRWLGDATQVDSFYGLESDRWELASEAAAERGNFGEPTDDDLAEGWRRCVALAMEYERSQAPQDKEGE
jgi:hypothetical protein